jgi:molybdopterin synthase catalytic subunit
MMLNEIIDSPLSIDRCLRAVARNDCGGIALFLGVVRDNSDGKQTNYLEYEAFEEMALDVVERIVAQARSRWEIAEVAMQHRTGRLDIGDVSVVIAVSAPHRAAAFEACRFVIDELKEQVPIWKKEHGPQGEVWVDGPKIQTATDPE